MSAARATLRLVAFVVFSLGCYVVWFAGLLVCLALPAAAGESFRRGVLGVWGRGCARIVGMRIEVRGAPPERPYFLVSNHLSYVDIVTLMATCPGTFVAKAEVASWPLLGVLSRAANTIFVDRGRRRDVVRVNDRMRAVLDGGGGVILFPEGTSSRGEEVLPFLSSLLEPAARIGHPVAYASLSYRTPHGWPSADLSVCWWGEMTFFDHLFGLLKLPGFTAIVTFGDSPVQGGDRRDLARRLRGAVSAAFTPVPQAEALAS